MSQFLKIKNRILFLPFPTNTALPKYLGCIFWGRQGQLFPLYKGTIVMQRGLFGPALLNKWYKFAWNCTVESDMGRGIRFHSYYCHQTHTYPEPDLPIPTLPPAHSNFHPCSGSDMERFKACCICLLSWFKLQMLSLTRLTCVTNPARIA